MRILLLLLLVLVAGGSYYYYRVSSQPEPVTTMAPASPEPAPESGPRYPLPGPDSVSSLAAETELPSGSQSAPPPEPLPALEESDEFVRQTLLGLLGADASKLLKSENLIHRAAVTVDNLPQAQVPPRFLLSEPVPGQLQVEERDGQFYLAESNYARYRPYVQRLEGLDAEAAVDQYVRLYPLFQQAFGQLGYPSDYFNDRLVAVIDELLREPPVEQPIRLVRPSVMYKFADPRLEALSAGQKTLIRMGPENAGKVRAKLRELRAALLERVEDAG